MTAMLLLLASASGAARASASDDPQIVYGPLMLALDASYQKWIAADGTSPPDAFQARLDARTDPYTVRFEATPAHHVTVATYTVAESSVLDNAFGAAPSWGTMHKGPLTMSGAYVVAFDTAFQYRKTNPPPGKTLAQLGSDASYGVIRVATWLNHNDYWVTMSQMLADTWSRHLHLIGCDVQQEYLVNATTFAVKYEPGCLPA